MAPTIVAGRSSFAAGDLRIRPATAEVRVAAFDTDAVVATTRLAAPAQTTAKFAAMPAS